MIDLEADDGALDDGKPAGMVLPGGTPLLGDLRATLAIMWDEFLPELGGHLRGPAR
ncbi:hypothetical protein ABZ490_43780 [Streptomyces sp. NPDC005811]|uniref:hypothetical protein n=1 Tax=Streptomyces sp. NPDC005811 TaxID=3154565 RepID=UPI0033EBCCC0